jgi:general secretion pathway protein D
MKLRVPALALLACVAVLVGCAEMRIRSDADTAMARGDHAAAVRTLEAGLRDHPESAPLRSALLRARSEAAARVLSQTAALRAQGRLADAEQLLRAALRDDPGAERLAVLLDEVAAERQAAATLAALEGEFGRTPPQALLQRVEAALRGAPRHAGLLALQRRLTQAARGALPEADMPRLAETRPISLDFRDVNLRTVLDVVSRHSGVNFIIDGDVPADARVTVLLRQTQVEDALDLIVSTGRLGKKVVDPKTIVVYPDTPDKRRQYQEQVVRVFHLASADARGAAAFLRAMAGVREPFVDERANMLALRDTPENIRLAERLILLYDMAEPEVLLELEVLEISSTRLTELGIDFPDSFSLTPLAPPGATGLTLGNLRDLNSGRIGVGVAGLLLNLKREVGDFTTLANPRVRVRNRQSAKILVGDKIPVITTTTGTGGFVSDSVNYLDVGLKLEVEPTVYTDDGVAIKIALEVSSLGSAVRTSSGTLAYQIGTRTASTLLRLRDGETQLLAGLISRDDRSSANRLPGVGDLPVVGRLFSSQQDIGSRKELVLAVTPRILRNLRPLDPAQAEVWVGTDLQPGLRQPPSWRAAASAAMPAAASPLPPDSASSAVAPVQPTPAQGTVSLGWQGPRELTKGQESTLTLLLESTAALRGLPLEIRFDPARIAVEHVAEGPYFSRDNAATSFTHSVDTAEGVLRAGVLRQQAEGVDGRATVLEMRVRALASGRTSLTVEPLRPVRLQTNPLRVAPVPPLLLDVR